MVVSVSGQASDIGVQILKQGGNAVDAAVATAFALEVTHPAAGNIGGGGFMVVYPGGTAEPVVIEYRETAPAAATRTMYRADEGLYGHRVVGVPGTVRGLALGALLRSTAGGIAALFGLLFAIPLLVSFLPGSLSDEIGKYLPGTAGLAVTTVRPDPVTSLGPWTGFGVFCAYAVVLLGLAAVRMRRGDA